MAIVEMPEGSASYVVIECKCGCEMVYTAKTHSTVFESLKLTPVADSPPIVLVAYPQYYEKQLAEQEQSSDDAS